APGDYTLRAESDANQPLSDALSLHLSSDERRARLELHSFVALSIRGRVHDHEGRPLVTSIRVVPVGPHERSFGAVSERDGSFEVAGLRAGNYDIVIDPDEGASTTLRVAAGTTDLDVHMPENEPVHGIVRDERGEPA